MNERTNKIYSLEEIDRLIRKKLADNPNGTSVTDSQINNGTLLIYLVQQKEDEDRKLITIDIAEGKTEEDINNIIKNLIGNIYYDGNSEELELFVKKYATSFGVKAELSNIDKTFSEFKLYLGEEEEPGHRGFGHNVSLPTNFTYGKYGITEFKVREELDQKIKELNSFR